MFIHDIFISKSVVYFVMETWRDMQVRFKIGISESFKKHKTDSKLL